MFTLLFLSLSIFTFFSPTTLTFVDILRIQSLTYSLTMKFSNFVAAGLMAASSTMAHSDILSRSEILRRGAMSKRCEASVGAFNKKRQAKRMAKREWGVGNSTVQITTEAPFFSSIQNDTCVLTPEATEGPYVWPRSQTLRQDMTEDQPGVPLWLDIGVLDMGQYYFALLFEQLGICFGLRSSQLT